MDRSTKSNSNNSLANVVIILAALLYITALIVLYFSLVEAVVVMGILFTLRLWLGRRMMPSGSTMLLSGIALLLLLGVVVLAGYTTGVPDLPEGMPEDLLRIPRGPANEIHMSSDTWLVFYTKEQFTTPIRIFFPSHLSATARWAYRDAAVAISEGSRTIPVSVTEREIAPDWGESIYVQEGQESLAFTPSFPALLTLSPAQRFSDFSLDASMTIIYPELSRNDEFENYRRNLSRSVTIIVASSEDWAFFETYEKADRRIRLVDSPLSFPLLGLTAAVGGIFVLSGVTRANAAGWRGRRRWVITPRTLLAVGLRVNCEVCGREAPVRHSYFSQVVGMIVARQHKHISGNMCKSCISDNFWGMTGTTLLMGWWSVSSFIFAPFILVFNIITYLRALSLPDEYPIDAPNEPRVLDQSRLRTLTQFKEEIFERLNRGEKPLSVATEVGAAAGVSPAQVILYVLNTAESA